MSVKKKSLFMNIIEFIVQEKFFTGFLGSFFCIIFYFFILKNQLFFLNNCKYFLYLMVIFQIFLYLQYCAGVTFSKKNIFFISSLIFTIVIIGIINIGSLWIFDHLNH
ncbi:Cytochrome bo(3) ubiquinol oxidase subunit 4 [Buchnera aphidicola (Cinara strobi)]|uniref:Cytochrome bo(3) ubiquinol oxidase subunit 4 n=1 Tax=Buchnera aphidicola (Cinara strobi) TaxID=1921549 RepID=A0A3B1E9L3_9GAMM|nr:Cytochrome bo(3) ubiquinol oxidase subunit 4 [Buchnera aphidicola (Cinara strobi)]